MENEQILKECIEYFKNTPGFKRIFDKIRDKYRSLGSLSGTVNLIDASKEEREALSGLFRKDFNKKSITIKVESFINALEDTRFAGVDFDLVMQGYFKENIISKKDEKIIYEEKKNKFFYEIISQFKNTKSEEWLTSTLNNCNNAYRLLNKRYDEDKNQLKRDVTITCKAVNELSFDETKTKRLAVFASEISKNPHCFDEDSECGKLLMYAISYFLNTNYKETAEEKAEILYKAGIIKDEVSNYTLCSGILAYSNGIPHDGWKGFYDAKEPLQVSIWNLSKLNCIISPSSKVFVFENPTVFSEVLYKTSDINASLICTFGQLKLASLVLLDKLCESGSTIYYSGDFDPEGLRIADRLKQRYGDKLILWHYTEEDYHSIKSKEKLDSIRIKKLEKLKNEELIKIGNILIKEGNAAYQELLINKYIQDVKTLDSKEELR